MVRDVLVHQLPNHHLCDMSYSSIIFDLGGVLIRLNYQRTIDAFCALGIEHFDELYNQANQNELFDQFETGKISPQRFINELLPYLPHGTSPNQVVQAWNAMILDVPASTLDILRAAKSSYHTVLLSNTNALHVPIVRQEWRKVSPQPMEDFFHHMYFSHELGLRKPHPETFLTVCEREGIEPNDTLFIDDSIQHIQGAQKAGLQTFHLQSIDTLHQLFS